MQESVVTSGLYMGNAANGTYGGNLVNTKNLVEDYLLNEYQPGLRNEFAMLDALINKLPKDTITGKVKTKTFALGITDNVRAVGKDNYDRYQLEFGDFDTIGADTVEAEFDTTKVMSLFGVTDEMLMKSSNGMALIDLVNDRLDRMKIGLEHTYMRYTYGGHDGLIGRIKGNIANENSIVNSNTETSAGANYNAYRDARGSFHNKFHYNHAPKILSFSMTNSHSLMEGMGAMIEVHTAGAGGSTSGAVAVDEIASAKRYVGRIFQKDNSTIHSEKIWFVVDEEYSASGSDVSGTMNAPTITWTKETTLTASPSLNYVSPTKASGSDNVTCDLFGTSNTNTAAGATEVFVYSRQLNGGGAVASEYHGLEDIVIRSADTGTNAILFGIDRRMYPSLRCTLDDYQGAKYLNEEGLRDMSDHLALTSPEGTKVSLVCANHRIISTVEKSLYQFKNYNLTATAQGMQLGGTNELRFDNYVLYKDAYARDNNVYMLDQQKIGELVRRDFTWITSGGPMGILERRDGTEFYEGIMNKYADMYVDAWRCHAAIKNVKVAAVGSYLSFNNDGSPKFS